MQKLKYELARVHGLYARVTAAAGGAAWVFVEHFDKEYLYDIEAATLVLSTRPDMFAKKSIGNARYLRLELEERGAYLR